MSYHKLKYVLLSIIVMFSSLVSNSVLAVHGDIQSAIALRKAIEVNPAEQQFISAINTTSKTLPISRGFHQRDTCLCWSYAFFNALETNSLVKDPDSKLELSRGAMQYINIKDRVLEKINGVDDHVNPDKFSDCWMEGGTAPDAADLIRKYGVYQYTNYHDVISPPYYTDIVNTIFAKDNVDAQYSLSESLLSGYFKQNLPTFTYYDGKFITAIELGNKLAGQGDWLSYSISKDGTDYQDKSLDPDARVGSVVNFTSRENILKIITDNLENNLSVMYGNDHHLTMIFGVEYDQDKYPVSLYIKDSYDYHDDGAYTYKADVNRLLNELGEITVYQE